MSEDSGLNSHDNPHAVWLLPYRTDTFSDHQSFLSMTKLIIEPVLASFEFLSDSSDSRNNWHLMASVSVKRSSSAAYTSAKVGSLFTHLQCTSVVASKTRARMSTLQPMASPLASSHGTSLPSPYPVEPPTTSTSRVRSPHHSRNRQPLLIHPPAAKAKILQFFLLCFELTPQ
jgi:hypothetical protein